MIEDPLAIRFANERIRYTADQLAQSYYALKSLVDDWNYQSIANVLPPGNTTDFIDDGSAASGGVQITPDDCYSIILRASEYVQILEANNNAKLASIKKVAPGFIKI